MAEVPSTSVWIVGAEHWPRALLRAELIERGYDATGFATLEDAVARLVRAPARRPALLVVDRRDQVVGERLAARLARARIPVLVVGDAAHPDRAPFGPAAEVLHRPLTIGDLADAVARMAGRTKVDDGDGPTTTTERRSGKAAGEGQPVETVRPTRSVRR